MSSIKKNILAAALVAGLGMAGAAAAYEYGTSPNLAVPEDVAYQQLFVSNNYSYTMTEGIVFDIENIDNAAAITDSFTVRVTLNSRCSPHDTNTNPPSPPTNTPQCAPTGDGALFDSSLPPIQADLVLDPVLATDWRVRFDGYTNGDTTANFRIEPRKNNPKNPSLGTMFTWNNARLIDLNEFADGTTDKVDAEFWMVSTSNDARFVNSTMSRTILKRVTGVTACATRDGAETDKYIDVADRWLSDMMPKSRFSFDGRLGSAETDGGNGSGPYGPSGPGASDYNEQWIDLGDVTITNNGAGSFAFLGSDEFHTEIAGGANDNWLAFDNNVPALYADDVWLANGNCMSGNFVSRGEVSGNMVYFDYTGTDIGISTGTGPFTHRLTVCGFVDSDTVIDDHNNVVKTTFTRTANGGNAVPTPIFDNPSCTLLPLRYNGSTMEIFTINPASNTTQRSFIRLTNRSATDGYASLEGFMDDGTPGASQVRVLIPAGASVQLRAEDLENGGSGAIGAWGSMPNVAPFNDGKAHKWRAVVTAEFPGLVATSLVNSALPRVLTNITDSDTRGEQYFRDLEEGNFANEAGQRPSDFAQETSPDFRGNGDSGGAPGGPNGSDGPAGGTTNPCGNEGYGDGLGHNTSTDTHDFSNEDPWCTPMGQ